MIKYDLFIYYKLTYSSNDRLKRLLNDFKKFTDLNNWDFKVYDHML